MDKKKQTRLINVFTPSVTQPVFMKIVVNLHQRFSWNGLELPLEQSCSPFSVNGGFPLKSCFRQEKDFITVQEPSPLQSMCNEINQPTDKRNYTSVPILEV